MLETKRSARMINIGEHVLLKGKRHKVSRTGFTTDCLVGWKGMKTTAGFRIDFEDGSHLITHPDDELCTANE